MDWSPSQLSDLGSYIGHQSLLKESGFPLEPLCGVVVSVKSNVELEESRWTKYIIM